MNNTMWVLWFACMLYLGADAANYSDSAANQLLYWYPDQKEGVSLLTTSIGNPVPDIDSNTTINRNLIRNHFFMDVMTHLNSERIPERVVHANGAGAFGYFEVTHNITHVCKAKLFSNIGKRTPIAVRFSVISIGRQGIDSTRDGRGFAVKFYTEDGNFDITGNNVPVFPFRDPIFFPGFVHAIHPNPVSFVTDYNALWDFLTSRPESFHTYSYVFSDLGIPDGLRYMNGFGIHTFQVSNAFGQKSFVRFTYKSNQGNKNITSEDQANLGGRDPDYERRDLYNAIARGDYPSWTLYIQVLSLEDVKKSKYDVFDVTRLLPEDEYPFQPVGIFTLNKNPNNFFADIEQLAFCPGNLVPGVDGAPDKLFEARTFAYRDAEKYRLGVNFEKIPVNCPFNTKKPHNYNRDGVPPVFDNGGGAPNYYPNTFRGPKPVHDPYHNDVIQIIEAEPYNMDQVNEFYLSQNIEQRKRMVQNIASSLRNADVALQWRALNIYSKINKQFASDIQCLLKN